jgi:GxxExxY protein
MQIVRSCQALDVSLSAMPISECEPILRESAANWSGTVRALARSMDHDYRITGLVIGCAIEVHKTLGPGLKEQAYEIALHQELTKRDIKYESQSRLTASYGGVQVGTYIPDLIVEQTVVIEINSVDRLTPLFTAQILAYLKVTGLRVGLILNFKSATMKEGIKRVVL